MSYRYEWTWKWEASKWSLTDIPQQDCLNEMHAKMMAVLLAQEGITSVESIRDTDVKARTDWLFNRYFEGTTTVTFTSSIKSESPIAPAIIALITIVVELLIVALAAWAFVSVSSNVREIVGEIAAKAPEALGLGAVAVILGILFLMGVRRK